MSRKRNNRVYFHLTDSELEKLNNIMERMPYTREEYVRQCVFGKDVYETPPAEYKEIVRELRIIGSNVHQLLQKAIQTKFIDELMIQDIYDTILSMDDKFERAFAVKRKKKRVSEWR